MGKRIGFLLIILTLLLYRCLNQRERERERVWKEAENTRIWTYAKK